jgi:hypothetical protein
MIVKASRKPKRENGESSIEMRSVRGSIAVMGIHGKDSAKGGRGRDDREKMGRKDVGIRSSIHGEWRRGNGGANKDEMKF